MRVYTCCPHDGCGAHADTVAFLKSWGVEPALGFDDGVGRHFLEFDVPGGARRRSFVNALFRKSTGGVLCYCGHWHEPDAEGNVFNVRCNSCERVFSVCAECAAEGTGGCPWCTVRRKRRGRRRRR